MRDMKLSISIVVAFKVTITRFGLEFGLELNAFQTYKTGGGMGVQAH